MLVAGEEQHLVFMAHSLSCTETKRKFNPTVFIGSLFQRPDTFPGNTNEEEEHLHIHAETLLKDVHLSGCC